MAELFHEDIESLPEMTFGWGDNKRCRICRRKLGVRVTRRRTVISLAYGVFTAIEKDGHCRSHPKGSVARSRGLANIVAPGANYAYDVLVRIGLSQILECRQASEISMELSPHLKLEIPEPTVHYLTRRFIAYFQVVHEESINLLRKAMHLRGGYILHIDGTCERASEMLFLCVDSISDQILESSRISSENHKDVVKILKDVRRKWGAPLAAVHDLRTALFSAVAEIFPGVAQFACHYHFAADVGKDILSPHQDQLRRIFRRTKVRAQLRALVRSLKSSALSQETGEHVVKTILALRSRRQLREQCSPEVVKGAVHALASWILGFARDGEGYGFPFDMPYLSLYERIEEAHDALKKASRRWPKSRRGTFGPLKKLRDILDTVVVGEDASEFDQIVKATRRDMEIFERLRAALRICPTNGKERRNDKGAPRNLSPKRHKTILENLRTSLKRRASRRGPSQHACEIVVEHLNKYWKYLFGHVLKRGSKTIVVPRTNNIDEGINRTIKRQRRRLHGRGNLGRDLESMPPTTPLVLNLKNKEYCQTVYGGKELEKIARRFRKVDPKKVANLMKRWREENISVRLPRKLERLTSLPGRVARFLALAVKELAA